MPPPRHGLFSPDAPQPPLLKKSVVMGTFSTTLLMSSMYVCMTVSFHTRPYTWNSWERSPLGRVYELCVSWKGSSPKNGPAPRNAGTRHKDMPAQQTGDEA